MSVERIEEPEDDDELISDALAEEGGEATAPDATANEQGDQGEQSTPDEPEEDA